jgi:hypothetical protein
MSSKFENINLSSIDRSSKKQLLKLNPVGFSINPSEMKLHLNQKKSSNSRQESSVEEKEKIVRLKIKKAWDLALAPAKSIPMNGFMMYMSGNSIQIFSIMITVMLFWNSLNAITLSFQGMYLRRCS